MVGLPGTARHRHRYGGFHPPSRPRVRVVGSKPNLGGTSRYRLIGVRFLTRHAWPAARTVLDAALLHEVIGPTTGRLTSAERAGAAVVTAVRARPTSPGWRIGVVAELSGDGYAPGVLAQVQRGSGVLETLGAKISGGLLPHSATRCRPIPRRAEQVLVNLAQFDADAVRAADR